MEMKGKELNIKLIGIEEDVRAIESKILPILYLEYVVTETSGYEPNQGEPGVHKFIRLRPMPEHILKNTKTTRRRKNPLGDSGREW